MNFGIVFVPGFKRVLERVKLENAFKITQTKVNDRQLLERHCYRLKIIWNFIGNFANKLRDRVITFIPFQRQSGQRKRNERKNRKRKHNEQHFTNGSFCVTNGNNTRNKNNSQTQITNAIPFMVSYDEIWAVKWGRVFNPKIENDWENALFQIAFTFPVRYPGLQANVLGQGTEGVLDSRLWVCNQRELGLTFHIPSKFNRIGARISHAIFRFLSQSINKWCKDRVNNCDAFSLCGEHSCISIQFFFDGQSTTANVSNGRTMRFAITEDRRLTSSII